MSDKQELVETKDYWTIIALEACGHVAEKIEPIEPEGGRSTVLVYTFPTESLEDYDAWMRGETRPPFDIVRKIQQSATQFKNNLHRYCK